MTKTNNIHTAIERIVAMDYLSIIDKYYSGQEELKALLLIHMQKEAMPNGWNPEIRRYELCEMEQPLILSPWKLDEMLYFMQ